MFLSIKEMEVRKIRFKESFEPGRLGFEDAGLRQATPLHAEGVAELLENTGGEVRVRGRFQVVMEADCDRCLAPAKFSLDEPFDLFYRPSEMNVGEDEVEIDKGETEIGFYQDGGLELLDLLSEQILLAIPMQRICRDDCRGICPQCGANRNEAECGCSGSPANPQWNEALKNFSVRH